MSRHTQPPQHTHTHTHTVRGITAQGLQSVLFLVVILDSSNSCHGRLEAPIFYRKFREVGIIPGEFIAFSRPPNNLYNILNN